MKTNKIKLLGLIVLTTLFFTSCEDAYEDSIIGSLDGKIKNTLVEKDGYKINLINQSSTFDSSIEDALITTFFEVYPKMVTDLNPNAVKSLNVIIDPTYDGVAYASNGQITIGAKWLTDHPEDTDLFTHELVHIIQSYPAGSPGWLVEGIADYYRDVYGINNAAAGWSLPTYSEGQDYKDGYGVTAGFLNSLVEVYDSSIVKNMDKNLRDGTYSGGLWVLYTDFSLPDLWLIYAGKYVEGGNSDWTNSASLTVSHDFPDGPNAGEGSLKVIDGDINSKFLIFDFNEAAAAGFWMQQELSSAVIVNRYTLTSGNDAPGRDPKDWTFDGSNDGTNWVTIDTRSGETFAGRNETKNYDFESTTEYKYYRMSITANDGDDLFQLSEWRLYEVVPKDMTSQMNALTVSHDYKDGPTAGEGSLKVVDGDTSTKFLVFDFNDALAEGFWMQQEFLKEEIINRYTLTSGNDAPARDPKTWTLAGSNDGQTWDEVDSRNGETFAGRNETKTYSFDSTTAYKYYRMTITANDGAELFQLSEWRLLRVE